MSSRYRKYVADIRAHYAAIERSEGPRVARSARRSDLASDLGPPHVRHILRALVNSGIATPGQASVFLDSLIDQDMEEKETGCRASITDITNADDA